MDKARWKAADDSRSHLSQGIRLAEKVSAKIHGVRDKARIYRILRDEFAKSKRYTMAITSLTHDGANLQSAETSAPPAKLKEVERVLGSRSKTIGLTSVSHASAVKS